MISLAVLPIFPQQSLNSSGTDSPLHSKPQESVLNLSPPICGIYLLLVPWGAHVFGGQGSTVYTVSFSGSHTW